MRHHHHDIMRILQIWWFFFFVYFRSWFCSLFWRNGENEEGTNENLCLMDLSKHFEMNRNLILVLFNNTSPFSYFLRSLTTFYSFLPFSVLLVTPSYSFSERLSFLLHVLSPLLLHCFFLFYSEKKKTIADK